MDYTFFEQLAYLEHGSERQRGAFRVLSKHRILEQLRTRGAILIGTLPLGIDVAESDLDIACEVHDFKEFAIEAAANFGSYAQYEQKVGEVRGVPYMCISFRCDDWLVELFAQSMPVKRQYGYRHMIAEYRVLQQLDAVDCTGRSWIVERKRAGQKTEPAFAEYLKLQGDPYEAMLAIADMEEDQLVQLINEVNKRNEIKSERE